MRKITSLLMLFCMCVCTALAQITDLNQLSNDKTYFIESARCFLTYSTAHTDCLASSNGKTVLADEKVKNPVENEALIKTTVDFNLAIRKHEGNNSITST